LQFLGPASLNLDLFAFYLIFSKYATYNNV